MPLARPHMSLQKMAVIPEACVNQSSPPPTPLQQELELPTAPCKHVRLCSPFRPLAKHCRLRTAKSFYGEFLSEYNQTSQRRSPGLAKGEREDEQDEQKEKGACLEVDGDVTHSILNDI